jgi:lipid-A-disaccharide synthase
VRLAVLAGEPSGDALGARVLPRLGSQVSTGLVVEGIGGQRMIEAGCQSLYPMETLSVMGLTEPLRRLPQLLAIRRALQRRWRASPPDVFLGIDSPDFNLPLERGLRAQGTPTAHLVSPSVWAWRRGRLRTIARAVDTVLCLFPFEAEVYRQAGIAHEVVGHPLADDLPDESPPEPARDALGLQGRGRVVALLPGSRAGEIRAHGPLFLAVAAGLIRRDPSLCFVLSAANAQCAALLEPMIAASPVPVRLVHGDAQTALAACDAALVVSGTATLEAALVKRPMVVAYRTGAITWAVLSRLVQTPHVALPNLLSGRRLVPEFLQGAATAPALIEAVWEQLEDTAAREPLRRAYSDIHHALRRDFPARVAAALLDLAPGRNA